MAQRRLNGGKQEKKFRQVDKGFRWAISKSCKRSLIVCSAVLPQHSTIQQRSWNLWPLLLLEIGSPNFENLKQQSLSYLSKIHENIWVEAGTNGPKTMIRPGLNRLQIAEADATNCMYKLLWMVLLMQQGACSEAWSNWEQATFMNTLRGTDLISDRHDNCISAPWRPSTRLSRTKEAMLFSSSYDWTIWQSVYKMNMHICKCSNLKDVL